MNESRRMYSVSQIALLCGVKPRVAYGWIRRAGLPASANRARGPLVAREDLFAFLRAKKLPIPIALGRAAKGRVLIVEDDRVTANAISRSLLNQGFDVAVANDGHEAARMVENAEFSLITLDLHIGEVDGFSFLNWISNRPQSRRPKIIVISGGSDAEIIRSLAMGPSGFLKKPFLADSLEHLVEDIMCLAA